ncbi:type II toxin-antitoxin system VapC family toxin [Aestuariivirga sp.]|uniref:type II toxin-antitoxin system VapC family toxin n=1 Tax=Aestuariivirga sp. TaxID=2650926 RepID=UPI003593FCBC
MFIDASALVAIIAGEADCEDLRLRLKAHRKRTISPLAEFEAALALARLRKITVADALDLVKGFKKIYAVKEIGIEPQLATIAIQAFQRYGRGQGHKAKLNMGDCFSYACAKDSDVPLLFKGNDFSQTDIKIA